MEWVLLAVAVLLVIAVLLPVGLALFLSEWLFGSIGWGILFGLEFSVLLLLVLVLAALRHGAGRVGVGLVLGILVGVGVGVAVDPLDDPDPPYAPISSAPLARRWPVPTPMKALRT